MELYPGFMLYRGLYEFAFFSVTGKIIGTSGMQWGDLTDSTNGMGEILIIMLFEWIVVLLIAYYIDQVLSSGKHPLFFLQRHDKKTTSNNLVLERQRSKVVVQIDKHDVREEVTLFVILLSILLLHFSSTHVCMLLMSFIIYSYFAFYQVFLFLMIQEGFCIANIVNGFVKLPLNIFCHIATV